MRAFVLLLLACSYMGAAVRADGESRSCSCTEEAAEVARLKTALEDKEQKANQLQEHIDTLKAKLAESSSGQNKVQSDLSDAQSKLQAVESELASKESKLKQAEVMLVDAKKELANAEHASRDSVTTCRRTLEKVQSDLSEQAAKLAELKALERAVLPAWLSRTIATTRNFISKQHGHVQKTDLYSQAVEKLHPHWNKAVKALQPQWNKAVIATRPARQAAAAYVQKAKAAFAELPIRGAVNSVKQQVSDIESELHMVAKQFISSQPSLSRLNDPVTLQLLVYSIMGLPVLLLSLLLVVLLGGPGKTPKGGSATAGKGAGAGVAAKRAASAGKPKGAALQQTPVGKRKTGKAVRDGGDVLYTP